MMTAMTRRMRITSPLLAVSVHARRFLRAVTTESACTPGEPAIADATCDNIDDDCDGQIDEDCADGANILSLTIAEEADDHHLVDLTFSQRATILKFLCLHELKSWRTLGTCCRSLLSLL